MAPRQQSHGRATPKKTAKKVTVDRSGKLSPKKLDEIVAAAEGWRLADLLDEQGGLTGKGLSGAIWLAIRADRPDLTPNDLYEMEDPADLGLEIQTEEPQNPTNAAG